MSSFIEFLKAQYSQTRIDWNYELHPNHSIRQTLWLKLRLAEEARSPYSETLLWIELSDGRVAAMQGANLDAL